MQSRTATPADAAAITTTIALAFRDDPVWGPGYLTSLGVQWQDGELKAVWPNGWEGIAYPGMVSYKIPPYMAEKYKK